MWKQISIAIIMLGFSAGGMRAQSDDLQPITIENARQLALIKTLQSPVSTNGYFAAAFSPNGEQLAIGQQGQLTLINIEDGITVAQIETGINFRPLNLYFSEDGNYLAAVDNDNFCVWDIAANLISLCESLVINLPTEYNDGMNYAMARGAVFSVDSGKLYVLSHNDGVGGIVIHSYELKAMREVDRILLNHCMSDPSYFVAFERGTTNILCTAYYGTRSSQTFMAVYDAVSGRLLSSWNNDGDIPAQFARFQFGLREDMPDADMIPLNPPSAFPYNRYQKIFNSTMTMLALIPVYGHGIGLYGVVDCTATATREVNLRTEPNVDSRVGATFLIGQRIALMNQSTSDGFAWWQTGDGLWLREDAAEVDCPQ